MIDAMARIIIGRLRVKPPAAPHGFTPHGFSSQDILVTISHHD
jgi:hypothetical protein